MAGINLRVSNKHLKIDKANTLVLVATAVTTVIVVFSLVAAQSLWKQISYQNKVISLRSKANAQLEKNIKSVDTLKTAFEAFENSTESVIGTADKNSKIVLDALPSKYDFPALATSLEGLITGSGSSVSSITGTDDEANAKQDSITPQPVEIPFNISAKSNFTSGQKLLADLQRSIRPFQITSLGLSGSDGNLQVTITGKTYYQPEKKLEIEQKVITNGNTTAKKTTVKKATK